MSIMIDDAACRGCGRCTAVCPGSLISLNKNGKAWIRRPQRCWGCASCAKECPVEAIALYLGADIGGAGGRMTVAQEGSQLTWTLRMPDGCEQSIVVNLQDANSY
ncbi:MAG: 4Fe-4S binding protein [Actinomycetia bacterium]|nr:4Fe-4S binding protein [Actinomycetes bacterium]